MKHIAKPALALMAFAVTTPAFAGGYSEPVAEPVVTTAAPVVPMATGTDWTGGYAGATLGYGWGGDALEGGDDATYGVFGGYNYDFGDFVVGGELEYLGSDQESANASLTDMTRLKLKAGYDMGSALVYGVVGAAYANADIGGTAYSDTGYAYGLGVDYALSDRINLGAEVLQNEFDEFGDSGSNLSDTTVGARVAFKF